MALKKGDLVRLSKEIELDDTLKSFKKLKGKVVSISRKHRLVKVNFDGTEVSLDPLVLQKVDPSYEDFPIVEHWGTASPWEIAVDSLSLKRYYGMGDYFSVSDNSGHTSRPWLICLKKPYPIRVKAAFLKDLYKQTKKNLGV